MIALYFEPHELRSREVKGGPKVTDPPDHLVPNMVMTLHAADIIREKMGMPVRVVSGYRSPSYNQVVLGSPTSEHVQFRALDLAADDHDKLVQVATEVMDAFAAKGVATGLGIYPSFVHIDIGSTKAHRRRW